MPIVTLRDLYVAELQDLADAERQILAVLPEMLAAATSSHLREAFQEHLEQTSVHADRLGLLLRKLGVDAGGSSCEAMRGIIAEGRRRIQDVERGDVLDAALIGAAQRVEHYEMAGYGCARTYAGTLDDGEAEQLLQQTLDDEAAADARLSRIAERGVNAAAGEDAPLDTDRQRARLRYVPASAIGGGFRYGEYRVRNAQEDDLGSVDGLVVDAGSGQPAYFVIDSGGWFLGQRFLVPIRALHPHDETRTLRTDLDRDAIRAYPPFTPDSYPRQETGKGPGAPAGTYEPPAWLATGVWMTEASGFAAVPPRARSDLRLGEGRPRGQEPMTARDDDEQAAGATRHDEDAPRTERLRGRGQDNRMSKERTRNEDARGGEVIVQDSVASGKPQLPTDRDPTGRETNVAIDADDLGAPDAERSDETNS